METEVLCGLFTLLGALFGFLVESGITKASARYNQQNHISITRFDKEFKILQELCEKNLTAVYDIGIMLMIVRGMHNDDKDKIRDEFKRFTDDINEAEFSNKKNALFITEKIFVKYKELHKKINQAYTHFGFWVTIAIDNNKNGNYKINGETFQLNDAQPNIERLQKEISDLSDYILKLERKYLDGLKAKL